MAARNIVRLSYEEDDVYASEATKVAPLSREAISELLESAERQEVASSAPPPRQSGVREVEPSTGKPPPSGTEMLIAIPPAPSLPVIYEDDEDDEDGLEPTRLSDRVAIPSEALVAQLRSEPPIIIEPKTLPTEIPVPAPSVAVLDLDRDAIAIISDVGDVAAPSEFRATMPSTRGSKFERHDWAVAVAAFVVTLVPALVALHYLLPR